MNVNKRGGEVREAHTGEVGTINISSSSGFVIRADHVILLISKFETLLLKENLRT